MNKQPIITLLLAFVAVVGTSDALDFCINYKDVAIAVNKDVAGNDIPDEKTAVGIATNRIHAVEANGGRVGVNHNKGVTCAWPVPRLCRLRWPHRAARSPSGSRSQRHPRHTDYD